MSSSIHDVEQRAITTLDQIKAMDRYPCLLQALQTHESEPVLRLLGEAKNGSVQNAEQTLYQHGLAAASLVLTQRLLEKGAYPDVLKLCVEAQMLCQHLGDVDGQLLALRNREAAAARLGDYGEALAILWQRLRLARRHDNSSFEASACVGAGIICGFLEQHEKALLYHQRALLLYQQTDDQQGVARQLNNCSMEARRLGQYELALDYGFKSLASLGSSVSACQHNASLWNNIGEAYLELAEYQPARNYFDKTLATSKTVGYRLSHAHTLRNLGQWYCRQGEYQQAKCYLQQALELSESLQAPVSIMYCQRLLMLVCERLYDFKQALQHSQRHNELRKMLFAKKVLYGLKSIELFYGAKMVYSDQFSA